MENNLTEKKVKVVSIRNIFNFPEFRGFEDVTYMTSSYEIISPDSCGAPHIPT